MMMASPKVTTMEAIATSLARVTGRIRSWYRARRRNPLMRDCARTSADIWRGASRASGNEGADRRHPRGAAGCPPLTADLLPHCRSGISQLARRALLGVDEFDLAFEHL